MHQSVFSLMKNYLFLLALLFTLSCSEDPEPNESPGLESFMINGNFNVNFLNANKDYDFSFRAYDDKNLKSYNLSLQDPDGNFRINLVDEELRGRELNISDTFNIPETSRAGQMDFVLSVSDFDGSSRSLSLRTNLIIFPPTLDLTTSKEVHQEGEKIYFSGSIRDGQDLESLRIFVHKEVFNGSPIDTIGEVFHLEFPGSSDIFFSPDSSHFIDLPDTMDFTSYKIDYRVVDGQGNYISQKAELPIRF